MALEFPIITTLDTKGINAADKAFKKLAGTFAAAFSVKTINEFSKASVRAFMEDEKAARRLSQTISNMGLAFEDPRIKSFISRLEATSGVLHDKLRPAMQALLTTTGSVTKSQELLALAIDMAAGSGADLTTVASDLSKAYVGNTRGLFKYNIGLTKTELSTKSFTDIQKILNKQFSGQNAAYLDTYAGKVDVLNVSYHNMKETIGKSLVDAFVLLSGDNGIQSATKAMADFATQISDTITGVSLLLNKLDSLPGIKNMPEAFSVEYIPVLGSWLKILSEMGKASRTAPKPFTTGMSVSGASDLYTKQEAARKKAEADALKRQKAILALQQKAAKDAAAREKATQQLKRAGSVFDMENIQIVAALQNRVTEENRLRLVALLAINNDNAEAADKLTSAILALQSPALNALGITVQTGDNAKTVIDKLIDAQTKLFLLNAGIATIPKAKNPFEDWASIMGKILADINAISAAIRSIPTMPGGSSGGTGGASNGGGTNGNSGVGGVTVSTPTTENITPPAGVPGSVFTSPEIPLGTYPSSSYFAGVYATQPYPNSSYFAGLYEDSQAAAYTAADNAIREASGSYSSSSFYAGAAASGTTVIVNVQGSVTTESDLAEAITNELYKYQKTGKGLLLSSTVI